MSTARFPAGARAAQACILLVLCALAAAFVPMHEAPWWPAAPSPAQAWLAGQHADANDRASPARREAFLDKVRKEMEMI